MSTQLNLEDVQHILGVNNTQLTEIRDCVNEYIKHSDLITPNGNIGRTFCKEKLLPYLKTTFRSVFVSETGTDNNLKLKAIHYLTSRFFHNQHRKVQITRSKNHKVSSRKRPLDATNRNISRLSSKKTRAINGSIRVYDNKDRKTLWSIAPINDILHDQSTCIDADDLDFDKWKKCLD
jgi:hypothetical protein